MKRFIYFLIAFGVFAAIATFVGYKYLTRAYAGVEKRINISKNINEDELRHLLVDSLDKSTGNAVYRLWKLRNGSLTRAHGSYVVKPGDCVYSLAMRIRGGMQDPVNVTVPNMREFDRCLDVISSNFEFDSEELKTVLDSILVVNDINPECAAAVILPDSYQYYWTSSATSVAQSLFKQWCQYWNDGRKVKASKLNLTPIEVGILASIIEEESARVDERPVIARLYMNRLDRNMKLQADPTVKYAVGDPTLRRILNVHLKTESPYNTYLVDGLPPGPIRMADKATLDAVLDAPANNYLYMCAREDFSGYHNFATSLSEHNANARRYHNALDKAKIR